MCSFRYVSVELCARLGQVLSLVLAFGMPTQEIGVIVYCVRMHCLH